MNIEMKKYVGVKLIGGAPMTLGQYNKYRGWEMPVNENPDRPGYLVEYYDPNGSNHPDHDRYISWSPAEQMESAYLEIPGDATKIDQSVVDKFLGTITSQQLDEKTTHVRSENLTGFVQHEVSSCVDPKNYDHDIGVEIATGKIKNTLWLCLGFVLQWGKYGLKAKISEPSLYPPHQERVLIEQEDLDKKIEGLNIFIIENPLFENLNSNERTRLIEQLEVMKSYSALLSSRIENF